MALGYVAGVALWINKLFVACRTRKRSANSINTKYCPVSILSLELPNPSPLSISDARVNVIISLGYRCLSDSDLENYAYLLGALRALVVPKNR